MQGRAASVVKSRAGALYGGARPEVRVEIEAGASAFPGWESLCEEPAVGPGLCGPPRASGPGQTAAASSRFSAEAPRCRAEIQASAGAGASGALPGSACPG